MPTYLIKNRVFEDIKNRTLEAENDGEAIKIFKRKYRRCTDDGGWRLTLADRPDEILDSTESSDMEKETMENYMTYA